VLVVEWPGVDPVEIWQQGTGDDVFVEVVARRVTRAHVRRSTIGLCFTFKNPRFNYLRLLLECG
jgi:hypothetical protein